MSVQASDGSTARPSTKPLRVLHVNASDLDGGAARAAHRIHSALRAIGVDSKLLVVSRREASANVLQPQSPGQRAMHRLRQLASNELMARQLTPTNPTLHSLNFFSSGLAKWINRSDVDVVNLHWLGGEVLSVEEIGRIEKPVCWTMHDMWPFCGAEHYDDLQHPGRYRGRYDRSNRPPGYSGPDLDAWVWRRKRKAWSDRRFHLVSPSRWLGDCARNSTLMAHQPCQVIPNCIDMSVFKRIERRLACQVLNLAPDKQYVLFGAIASTEDPRKGFELLRSALGAIAANSAFAGRVELLVFGAHPPSGGVPDLGLPAHFLGTLHDEVGLALLYNAADVFVAPSMQENFPNTVVESLACGTPCAAFRVGGLPDLIDHGSNGWLAEPYDTQDLSSGIVHLLQRDRSATAGALPRINMCAAASIASDYNTLYEQMLSL